MNKHNVFIVLLVMTLNVLVGCSSDLKDYQQASPKFELFEYFSGNVKAWGMVPDYPAPQT